MTNFNFEGQPEGDWEDKGNLSWSELDWQRFLKRQEKEISRFLKHYDECPVPATERLDWVARQMGWDSDDWSVGDFPDDDEDDEDGEAWNQDEEVAFEPSDMDPYTLHRHPVYIVTVGLFMQIRHIWTTVMKHHDQPIDGLLLWEFSQSLSEAERQSLMAMQSMDMGDFMVCIVHLKRSMRSLNFAMSLLTAVVGAASAGEFFRQSILARLFDLREVCIRVIQDCRGEDRRI